MRDLTDWKGCPPPAPVALEGRTVRIEPYQREKHLQALWDAFGGMEINPLLRYFTQADFAGIEDFDAWSEAVVKSGWVREVIVDKAAGKVVGEISVRSNSVSASEPDTLRHITMLSAVPLAWRSRSRSAKWNQP